MACSSLVRFEAFEVSLKILGMDLGLDLVSGVVMNANNLR